MYDQKTQVMNDASPWTTDGVKTVVDGSGNPAPSWNKPGGSTPTVVGGSTLPPGATPAANAGWHTPPYPPAGVPAPAVGSKTMVMEVAPQDDIPLAWLAIVASPSRGRGEVFRLGQDTVLGRNTTAEIQIQLPNDRAISSRHLKIKLEYVDDDPARPIFVLYDQGSANKTYVGTYQACKEARKENIVYRVVLNDGDCILIGETILVFKQVTL